MTLPPGTVVERYRIEYVLGRGGVATVYAVRHPVLGTRHALKVIDQASPASQERLVREGGLQARLDPQFVVPVMDVVSVRRSPALLMPLVVGCALDEVLADHRLSEDEVISVFGAVVRGVASAHAEGVVHRDLRPGNVLLEEKRGRVQVRVADFGLARAEAVSMEGSGATATRAGTMMGTPAYAAPEQLADAAGVDHRADLWSLGVMLYELLTGERPFQARSIPALAAAVLRGTFDREAVTAVWRPLLDDLLRVDPADRLGSAEVLAQRLTAIGEPAPQAVGSPIAEVIRKRIAGRPTPAEIDDDATFGVAGRVTLTLNLTAPTEPPPRPAHNLPSERDAFVGRSADLSSLKQRLDDGAHLVSLLGMGGTGKTRLALHFGWQHLDAYPGGGWFCDLSDARTIDGIASAVARALHVPLGKADPVMQLGHAIAGRRRCLVILDNFEQMARHAPDTLGRWLDRATEAQFVVTTREVLGLPGEEALALPPLAEAEAVDLFVARARSAERGFTLTDATRPDVHALVKLLDGLPLAIELAAARVRVMNATQLLSRIGQRFKLLSSSGGRLPPPRHPARRARLELGHALRRRAVGAGPAVGLRGWVHAGGRRGGTEAGRSLDPGRRAVARRQVPGPPGRRRPLRPAGMRAGVCSGEAGRSRRVRRGRGAARGAFCPNRHRRGPGCAACARGRRSAAGADPGPRQPGYRLPPRHGTR